MKPEHFKQIIPCHQCEDFIYNNQEESYFCLKHSFKMDAYEAIVSCCEDFKQYKEEIP